MARLLITADLHLTNRPVDDYRWEIFPWLETRAIKHKADGVCILGDLTDLKDNHGAFLVNRLARAIRRLAAIAPVHILAGNHDYADPAHPFFNFLNGMEGVYFYTVPKLMAVAGAKIMFLPHTRKWRGAWDHGRFPKADFIFLHQPLIGARGENGQALTEGAPPSLFAPARVGKAICVAGDIHTPQQVGNVTYAGAPYPVNFGDSWEPRVLYWNGAGMQSLRRTTLRKAIIDCGRPTDKRLKEYAGTLSGGDQVRFRYHLPRARYSDWAETQKAIRKTCEQYGWVCCGITMVPVKEADTAAPAKVTAIKPAETLRAFCKARKLGPTMLRYGLKLLEAV